MENLGLDSEKFVPKPTLSATAESREASESPGGNNTIPGMHFTELKTPWNVLKKTQIPKEIFLFRF